MILQIKVIPKNDNDKCKAEFLEEVINRWLEEEENSEMIRNQVLRAFLNAESGGLDDGFNG